MDSTTVSFMRVIGAFGFVLAMLALLGYVLKRWGAKLGGGRPNGARLRVVETLYIDPRHRVVLLRRDEVEHMVLIGAAHDVVIESGITPPTSKGEGHA